MENTKATSFDLEHIPVKYVTIIKRESDTSRGLIVGSPIQKHATLKPDQFFSKWLSTANQDENITCGSFLYIKNIDDIHVVAQSTNPPQIHRHTLFYYIRFAHRLNCISFYLSTKTSNAFRVCCFVRKVSLHHINEWAKYEPIRSPTGEGTPSPSTRVEAASRSSDDESTPPPNMSTPPPPIVQHYLKTATRLPPSPINTTHGMLSLDKVLKIKIRQRNIVCVFGIPLQIAEERELKSDKFFGRFGRILSICIDGSVSITFASDISALNAMNFCNRFTFPNGHKMSATYGFKTYCQHFVLYNKMCAKGPNCSHLHSWYDVSKVIKDISDDSIKEQLRHQMTVMGKTHRKLSWNEFKSRLKDKHDGDIFDIAYYFEDIFEIKTIHSGPRAQHTYLWSKIFEYESRQHDPQIIELQNQIKRLNQEKEKSKVSKTVEMNELQIRSRQFMRQIKDLEQKNNILKGQKNDAIVARKKYEKLYNELMCEHKELKNELAKRSFASVALRGYSESHKTNTFVTMGGNVVPKSRWRRTRPPRQDKQQQSGTEKCKQRFRYWLSDVVGLQQYLACFEEMGVDNIVMIPFLTAEYVQNELKITDPVHCQLLVQRVEENKFTQFIQTNHVLKQHKNKLIRDGIVTLPICKDAIKSKKDLRDILKIDSHKDIELIYSILCDTKQ